MKQARQASAPGPRSCARSWPSSTGSPARCPTPTATSPRARRTGGDDLRRPADPLRHGQRRRRLRHAFRPGAGLQRQPAPDLRRAARLPARPRGPRPRRPGPGRDLERVRTPPGGERDAAPPAPTTAPRAAPSSIGSKAKGQMVGEFPGLATLDDHDNLRHTSDFRAMYCSLLEQWLGQDAGPIIPGASKLRAALTGQGMSRRPILLGLGALATAALAWRAARGAGGGRRPGGGGPTRARLGLRLAQAHQAGRPPRPPPRQAAPDRPGQALVDLRPGRAQRPGAPRGQGLRVQLRALAAERRARRDHRRARQPGRGPPQPQHRPDRLERAPDRPISRTHPRCSARAKRFSLTPGTYELWCDLPEHEALGMHATLSVTAS